MLVDPNHGMLPSSTERLGGGSRLQFRELQWKVGGNGFPISGSKR